MEALIVLVVLALLAIPLLLVVAQVMIAGLRRRVAALESEVADGIAAIDRKSKRLNSVTIRTRMPSSA